MLTKFSKAFLDLHICCHLPPSADCITLVIALSASPKRLSNVSSTCWMPCFNRATRQSDLQSLAIALHPRAPTARPHHMIRVLPDIGRLGLDRCVVAARGTSLDRPGHDQTEIERGASCRGPGERSTAAQQSYTKKNTTITSSSSPLSTPIHSIRRIDLTFTQPFSFVSSSSRITVSFQPREEEERSTSVTPDPPRECRLGGSFLPGRGPPVDILSHCNLCRLFHKTASVMLLPCHV